MGLFQSPAPACGKARNTRAAFFLVVTALMLALAGCRTHKVFETDTAREGLSDQTLGVTRAYKPASLADLQNSILDAFNRFGNRVNVEGANPEDARENRFSVLMSQALRTQMTLYDIDMGKPLVLRATYPTHEVRLLKIKENVHRVYVWVEPSSGNAEVKVRLLVTNEEGDELTPKGVKYTAEEFLDAVQAQLDDRAANPKKYRPPYAPPQ